MLVTLLWFFHVGRRFAEDRHFGITSGENVSRQRAFRRPRFRNGKIHPRSVGQKRHQKWVVHQRLRPEEFGT